MNPQNMVNMECVRPLQQGGILIDILAIKLASYNFPSLTAQFPRTLPKEMVKIRVFFIFKDSNIY